MNCLSDLTLMQGDCLELMKQLPDGSIDLTVTSPPYDDMRTYNGNAAHWNFDKFKLIALELHRITKDGGVVVWIVGDATVKGSESGTSFRQALFFKEIGFNLHDTMIYQKLNPMPRDTRIPRYWQAFDYMFILSKGKPLHFNWLREATKTGGEMRGACGSRLANGEMRMDRRAKTADHTVGDTKPRTNIWGYGRDMIKNIHPAQYPVQLAADNVMSWSNPGDLVLDPFMGSGSTGVACINTGRRFIGMELDEGYFKIAQRRIGDVNYENQDNIDD